MMEAKSADFPDWEMLHNSDSDSTEDPNSSLQATDSNSVPLVRSDYFSLSSQLNHATTVSVYDDINVIDHISMESDTLVSIHPEKIEEKHELGFFENEKDEEGIDQIEEIVIGESDDSETGESRAGFSGEGVENSEMGIGEQVELDDGVEDSSEKEEKDKDVVVVGGVGLGGDGEKRMALWWKIPFEIFKSFVFRISPVWTVSVAVAAMGFVILGRRYYMMKRKSRSMQFKVTVDDKKVSQFMSRAARLNEAFSVVKRVPAIRPSLPAAGLTQWPMMTLR